MKTNQIEYLRKKNKMSQENLADKLGITRQTISEWERCEAYPSVERLIQLSELFNVSLDFLIFGKEHERLNTEETETNEFKFSRLSNTNTYVFGEKDGQMVSSKDNEPIGNTIIIGGCGSGKTRSIIFPNILQALKREESIIINDVKGEIYDEIYDKIDKEKYDIKVLNLQDYNKSDTWPIFTEMLDFDDSVYCDEILEKIYNHLLFEKNGDVYIENSCLTLFKAVSKLILLDATKKPSQKSFKHITDTFIKNNIRKLNSMFNTLPIDHPAKDNFAILKYNPEILNELYAKLCIKLVRCTDNISFSKLTDYKDNNININNILCKKTALFIKSPMCSSYLSNIMNLFFDILRYKLNIKGKGHNISLFLDEAQSLGNSIEKFQNKYYSDNMDVTVCMQRLLKDKVDELFVYYRNIVLVGNHTAMDLAIMKDQLGLTQDELQALSNRNYAVIKRNMKNIIVRKEFDH